MRAQGPNAQCVCVCTVTPNVVLANHENTINLCMLCPLPGFKLGSSSPNDFKRKLLL